MNKRKKKIIAVLLLLTLFFNNSLTAAATEELVNSVTAEVASQPEEVQATPEEVPVAPEEVQAPSEEVQVPTEEVVTETNQVVPDTTETEPVKEVVQENTEVVKPTETVEENVKENTENVEEGTPNIISSDVNEEIDENSANTEDNSNLDKNETLNENTVIDEKEDVLIDDEAEQEEIPEDLATTMPAQEFEEQIENVHVKVTADIGTFYTGTTMKVSLVEPETVKDKIEEKVEDFVDNVVAVDITFYDAEDNIVEPLKQVKVEITSDEIAQMEEPIVAHLADDGNAEIVDQKEEIIENDKVGFEADSFSVYAVFGTIETTYITADGQSYSITVTYSADSGIPKDAKLEVREITSGSEEYSNYNTQALNNVGANEVGESVPSASTGEGLYELEIVNPPMEENFARYFDITIISNGVKIEPLTPVDVKIKYNEPIDLTNKELNVVHFADTGIETITPTVNGSEISFKQSSFSVTGTITTTINNDNRYAVLVQYEGSYYEVKYDGTLEKVTASGNNSYTIAMAEAWTYNSNRIYVTKNNGIEYISPNNNAGISSTDTTITITASGNGYRFSNNNQYLGVTTDPITGQLKLSGNNSSDNAATATFYFATLSSSVTNHTVDHIDIGVEAKASVEVPLAFGTYYYADGSVAETVAIGEYKNATGINNAIPINEQDLMSANISSYRKDSNGNRTVDNSFIITEYTSSTQQGEIDQVRIGGTFPIGEVTLSGNGRRATSERKGDIERFITSDNQIHYEVAVQKVVSLTLQKNGETLYQKDSNGALVPLTVDVSVTLTSSFSYWDDDNECPGIDYCNGFRRNWSNYPLSPSGMDFRLGTTDEADASISAIEIIKNLVDEDGNTIELPANSSKNFTFKIFNDADGDVTKPVAWSGETTETVDYSGYTELTDRTVNVSTSGIGIAYDYSVDSGLVYIEEDSSSIPQTITDKDGNELAYDSTYIKTEYAWRDDNGQMHSNVNQENTLAAIPDVVGDYYSTTYGGKLHNTFLEFYVYNVYKPQNTEISVTKEWSNIDGSTTPPQGASVVITLYKNGTATDTTITLDGTIDTNGEKEAWVATFENLPILESGQAVTYTAAETTGYAGYTMSPTTPVADGGTITNTQDATSVYATKEWVNVDGSTTAPANGTVVYTLYRNNEPTTYTVTLDGAADTVPTGTAGYESEAWKATFVNLPKSKVVDGAAVDIVYTIAETTTYPGYTPDKTDAVASGSTITNKQETTTANATKAWKNADGSTTVPEGATVVYTLYRDGNPTTYTVTLDGTVDTAPTVTGGYESEAWKATFVNLPKYKEGTTTEIVYTVAETTTYPGYTADSTNPVASGLTITNKQEVTTANALKAWLNADGTTGAPQGATVEYKLYADGTATNYTVTLDGTAETTAPATTGGYESDSWKATFVNLPKYQDGTTTEIVYTVAETTTYPGYTPDKTDAVASGSTITNKQEVTTVNALKAWLNADGTTGAPQGATVEYKLYADGTATNYTVTLDGTAETTAPATTGGYESDSWKATFVNLPKYQDGTTTEIVYTVAETTTYPGYTPDKTDAVASGLTITNKQETTTANATKAWKNADGTETAPNSASVVYTLYANGTATQYTVALDGTAETTAPATTGGYESEAWKATFVNLPKSKVVDGAAVDIVYTVAETTPYPGYEADSTDPVANGSTITNIQEVGTAKATKAWKNADGTETAPNGASVVYTLYANGTATNYTVTLDGTADTVPTGTAGYESEAWVAQFINLPAKDASGANVDYKIKETTPYPGYTADSTDPVASGLTITNKQEVTTANALKAWLNADGTTGAPQGATVEYKLYADGTATNYTVTLDGTAETTAPATTGGYESDSWKATFVNLPKYQDGTTTEIVYTVAETTTYPGYTPDKTDAVASGSTITNKQEVTTVNALKAWLNADGTTGAPQGATVEYKLYADGTATNYTVTLDGTAETTAPATTGGYESDSWKATFVNLPKYQDGTTTEIVYTVAETTPYPGYTADSTDPVASGLTITNKQEATTANALKAWKNADGTETAPNGASVVYTLYANGTATSYTVTLDGTAETTEPTTTGGYESDSWKAEFVNLPKYKEGTTTEIVYTVAETTPYPGYTADSTDPVASGLTITNKQEATTANALKAWKNADGTETAPNGASVVYTLYADGTATSYTVTLDGTAETTEPTTTGGYESEAWKAEFVNLPKYKEGTTTEIVYTVAETTPYPGYTADSTDPVASGLTITNKQEATTANALKAWKNADGTETAPNGASVVYTLYADGTATSYTVTLDGTAETTEPTTTGGYESDSWKAEFVNLPKYKEGTTTEIVYTVAETTPYPGYTASTTDPVTSGSTITNTQASTTANATKAWKNADGSTTAPEGAKVTYTLYADDEATKYTVELDGATDTKPTGTAGYESEAWKAEFVNLPKYKEGTTTEIVYTVAETTPYPGYTASPTGKVASGSTITNTQASTTANATKAWKNADETTEAPEGGTVVYTLYRNGEETEYTVTLDGTVDDKPEGTAGYESEAWKAEFINLPKTDSETGDDYTYTIAETEGYRGYTASTTDPVESGSTITNTYTAVGQVDIEATKVLQGRKLKADEFSFVLSEGDSELQTKTNAEDGTITFDTIKYTLEDVGVHTYTITEKAGNLKGVTYSSDPITVTVDIKENGNDPLIITTEYSPEDKTITNTYEAKGSITFEGIKSIDCRDLAERDVFTFEVTDGVETWTAQNDITGKINYPTIEYTINPEVDDSGTHTYTVRETSKNGDGITVDTNEYTVTVDVEDNGDGTLSITPSDNYTALDFVNTYEAEGEITLEAYKSLEGKDLEEGEFSFVLSKVVEEAKAPITEIETVTNDAEGKVTFTTLEYDQNDIGKTYTYLITEVDDVKDGYVYDDLELYVTVTVEDNLDGTLNVTAEYSTEDRTFYNRYETVEISVEKVWDDKDNQDGIRPESIEVVLLANGEETENTATLNEENNWSTTWTGLVKHSNRENIEYTVKEIEVDKYESSIETIVDETTGNVSVTITNSYTPETISIKVTKVWDDFDNKFGCRPDTITVRLYADDKEVKVATISKNDNWVYTWKDLAKYNSGKEIKYSISEDKVNLYKAPEITGNVSKGFTIKNPIESMGGEETPPIVPGQVINFYSNPSTRSNDHMAIYISLIVMSLIAVAVVTKKEIDLNKKAKRFKKMKWF